MQSREHEHLYTDLNETTPQSKQLSKGVKLNEVTGNDNLIA